LPNDIKIPITAVNNHNGLISNEIRLIFVVESNTGLPLYYRYVPGNIIDVSTLNMVINELKVYKVKVNRAVIDAGYYSKDNLLALHKNNIPFIIRIPEKLNLYKNLIEKHWKDLDSKSNYVIYNNRHLFIKKIGIKLFGSKVDSFAYVCLDTDKARKDQKNFLSKKLLFVDDNEYQCKKQSFGIFVLLSTENIKISNLLPYYYARQGVEQIFDYLKNEIDILPIRVHSEKTFNGHLLLSFMSLMGYISFNNALKKMNLSASIALDSLGRFHSRVYHKRIIPDVANKSVNDICKALNIKIPNYIKI
jgi:transposase